MENWLPTLKNKTTFIEVQFIEDHLVDHVHFLIDHIMLDAEKSSFVKMFMNSEFCSYDFNPYQIKTVHENISTFGCVGNSIPIYKFPMGILIYLTDNDMVQTYPFGFSKIKMIVNEQNIEIQQKEIFVLEPNIYYIPLILEEMRNQNLMKTQNVVGTSLF